MIGCNARTERPKTAGGYQIERVPRKVFVSPLREGARPAWAKGLRRGYLGTGEWAADAVVLCRGAFE